MNLKYRGREDVLKKTARPKGVGAKRGSSEKIRGNILEI